MERVAVPAGAVAREGARRRAGPTERPVTVAASWPQAPSISRPRVSLTVTATPWAAIRSANSSPAPGREAVHFEPGVGFSGHNMNRDVP
jgi:hypothetical protein